MALTDRIADRVTPLLTSLDLRLYDVELNGGTLRITVMSEDGLNLDRVAEATRAISRSFDDDDPMPGAYTLEVSSPGLERRLRTADHFAGAVGELVSIKLGPHVDGERRLRGTLSGMATDDAVTVVDDDGHEHQVTIADITKATTVFEWGPSPKPGTKGAEKPKAGAKQASAEKVDTKNATKKRPATTEPGPSDAERRAPAR